MISRGAVLGRTSRANFSEDAGRRHAGTLGVPLQTDRDRGRHQNLDDFGEQEPVQSAVESLVPAEPVQMASQLSPTANSRNPPAKPATAARANVFGPRSDHESGQSRHEGIGHQIAAGRPK